MKIVQTGPLSSPREQKADATTRIAMSIIGEEDAKRVALTRKLREQRLARETGAEAEQPAEKTARKKKKAGSAAG